MHCDCRTLIGSSVINEPHISLKRYTVALAQGEYYECLACRLKLLRKHNENEAGVRWQLVF